MIDEDQLNYHIDMLSIWVNIVRREVEWEVDGGDHSYPKKEKVQEETVDCIIAGLKSKSYYCPVCVCNCCLCWENTQWDEIVLKPEETLCTFPWFMEVEENEEGEEELKIRRGMRFDDVIMKLGWNVK